MHKIILEQKILSIVYLMNRAPNMALFDKAKAICL